MHVIGTAGHVDHGKSTLVHALTGIDPDRLKEEKARGMTIDLGFAWIELPMLKDGAASGQTQSVGVVDVPGHIDFIKNMLAGVGGIDAALLVIAADEGVMPQTREHLAILDLLAVPAGLVALTKVDLIDDPEWLDLIELDLAELLHGTRLADAPMVRVSAQTGVGLTDLRLALAAALGKLPSPRNRMRPRLPVDRIFSLSGFGTVVTGTLSDGPFQVGDAIEILPAGKAGRIRGLQSHKQPLQQAEPGNRLAINLSGVATDEIHRGDVVVRPHTLQSTLLVDVAFRLLADAPKPLVHNQGVDFYSGAAEVPAKVRILGADQLDPGQEGWLQLRLARPVVVASGDRFILRQPSPSTTLGGGAILSPHPRRRWKRFDPAVVRRLETLAQGAPDAILLQTLARQPFLTQKALFGQSGLDLDLAEAAFAELMEQGAVVRLGEGADSAWLALDAWSALTARLAAAVDEFHRQHPLRRGIPRGELRSRLQMAASARDLSVRQFNATVDRGCAEGLLGADDTVVWRAGFTSAPTLEQQMALDHVLAAFASAPNTPPNAGDTLRMLGGDEELLGMMVEQGTLLRLGGGVLFRTSDFDAMTARVRAHIQERGSITLAESRDLLDTSRKYAQAVLEELDARRITRREGDARVLR